MDLESVREKTRAFFEKAFPGHQLGDDDDIFSRGFVNSLKAMQMVMFVEHEFGFPVTSEDMDFANFRSISAITELVSRKLKAAS